MGNQHRLGLWVGICAGIGAAVGVAAHDWLTGAGVGAAIGVVIALVELRRRARPK